MCGRYTFTEIAELVNRFGLQELTLHPRYNLAPTQQAPIVPSGDHPPTLARWGLIPHWAKDTKTGYTLINARAETLAEKPTFRGLLPAHRCLVPADGFYEWHTEGKVKTPHRFVRKDRQPFAFAGLYSIWNEQPTFTIVTTTANWVVRFCHDRMPVILTPETERLWTDPAVKEWEDLQPALVPYPEKEMEGYRVAPLVNSAKVDSNECIQPAE